jgi:cholesterol oxidase
MISRPVSQLESHYPIVVVGSGYGGSIVASRLARAGQQVCLFERGRERWPGEYPDKLVSALRKDVQARTPRGRFGNPTGLFDFRFERDINVLVGCGLGGTSLINANVALRPGIDVFDDERWPHPIRGDRDLLEPYFRVAEQWLGSNPYPTDRPTPPKLTALEIGATAVGETAERTPINVTFTSGFSSAGVPQAACNDCGDCVTGCNVGAKNTVLMNYLPDAHHHGAQIFCQIEVDSVTPSLVGAAGRWTVWFRVLGAGREHFDAPNMFVTADTVVLGAGALGSTEILLRSRRAGLAVSEQLGKRFSGNGDVLGFGADADRHVNGVGFGRRAGREPVGPTITGVIDLSDRRPSGHGLVIEEGSFPSLMASMVPIAFALSEGASDHRGLLDRVRGLIGWWRSKASRTLPYLVMSADDDDGQLSLEDDRLEITWPGAGSEGAIIDDNDMLRQVTAAIGASYIPDPLWTKPLGKSLITVHALGGCVMSDDASTGVVDHVGRIFSHGSGSETHDGLYVADGSVIPRPVDLNPLLTISALAERTAAEIATEHGWTFDTDVATGTITGITGPGDDTLGIRLTERMAGWFQLAAADYTTGERTGKSIGSPMDVVLTLDVSDLDATVADASTVQLTSGTVTAPALSADALAVTDGRFQLRVPQTAEFHTWHMHYAMNLVTTDGRRFRFDGHKIMHDGPIWQVWRATTTLFVDVYDQHDEVVGRGILRTTVGDLLRQLCSARMTGTTHPIGRLSGQWRFARAFLGDVLRAYGRLLPSRRATA